MIHYVYTWVVKGKLQTARTACKFRKWHHFTLMYPVSLLLKQFAITSIWSNWSLWSLTDFWFDHYNQILCPFWFLLMFPVKTSVVSPLSVILPDAWQRDAVLHLYTEVMQGVSSRALLSFLGTFTLTHPHLEASQFNHSARKQHCARRLKHFVCLPVSVFVVINQNFWICGLKTFNIKLLKIAPWNSWSFFLSWTNNTFIALNVFLLVFLNPAHVPYEWLNNQMFGEFWFTI